MHSALRSMAEAPDHQADQVTVLNANKDWAIGIQGGLLIVIFRGQLTEAAIGEVNERLLKLTQERPERCAYICVIERNSPPPAGPVRRLAINGLSRLGKSLTCSAAVMEGNDLRSTLVRAILTGNAMVRPSAQPSKYFKNTDEMSVWVKKMVADATSDIVGAVETLRQRMPT